MLASRQRSRPVVVSPGQPVGTRSPTFRTGWVLPETRLKRQSVALFRRIRGRQLGVQRRDQLAQLVGRRRRQLDCYFGATTNLPFSIINTTTPLALAGSRPWVKVKGPITPL